MEVWKKINGFEDYEISNLGRVKSLKKGELILKNVLNKGYFNVWLCKNNSSKKMLVSRLVALNFIDNNYNYLCVNHINGIKTDNRVENLEWCTHSENTLHAFKTGLKKPIKGDKNIKTKIKESDLITIKESKEKLLFLANKYNLIF